MKAEVLNAFLGAAMKILRSETHGPVRRTGLFLDQSDQVSDPVTVYVALVGGLRGMVLVGMSTQTARGLAGAMLGQSQPELSEMGMSALAELGNLISGGAAAEVEATGLTYDITPPTLMIGRKLRISTLALSRFVIPLQTDHGVVNLQVAADIQPV